MKFYSHRTLNKKKQNSRWLLSFTDKTSVSIVGKSGVAEFTTGSSWKYGVNEECVKAAIILLNSFASSTENFKPGDTIIVPTALFFVDKNLQTLVAQARVPFMMRSNNWFDNTGELNVSAASQEEANTIAAKWFRPGAISAAYLWNGKMYNLTTVKLPEVVVKPETAQIDDHIKQADKNPQLQDELAKLDDDLSYGLFDWAVTDGNVEDALKILQTAKDRDYKDFAWLALQLKKKGLIGRVYKNVTTEQIAQYPDLLIQLAYFRPTGKIMETISDVGGELNNSIQKSILLSTIPGIPPFMIVEEVLLAKQLKTSIHPLEDISAFFDLKLYEIQYNLEQGNIDYIKSLLKEVFFIIDFVLEELFSEGPRDSAISKEIRDQTSVEVLPFVKIPVLSNDHGKWQPTGAETLPPITYTDPNNKNAAVPPEVASPKAPVANNNIPPAPVTPTAVMTYPGNVIVPSPPVNSSPANVKDEKSGGDNGPGLSTMVNQFAAIAGQFFGNLNDLTKKYPEFGNTVNEEVEQRRKEKVLTLNNGVIISDDKSLSALSDSIKNQLTWYDIAKIWFWEIGSETDVALNFGEGARTTMDLQKEPAIQKIIADARARVASGNTTPMQAWVSYNDVTIFKNSLKTRNIPFNFLGSFNVIVKINDDKITLKVSNQSDWQSATRFGGRKDPDKPFDILTNTHTSVIDSERTRKRKTQQKHKTTIGNKASTETQAQEINLGGALAETWEWTEKF